MGSYVKEGQCLSEYRVSLAERKEKSRFLTVSGSVERRLFWKVPLIILHIDNDSEA